jgi:pyridoxine/pyridoxamine 5'-phosphate oxidase
VTDSLANILRSCWDELGRGVVDRRHGFHVPTLASIACDGAPCSRAVVLRRVDAERCEIQCHTDARSGKVAEFARDPRVAWHFYDESRKLQLRVSAVAEFIVHGPRADDAWAASALSSRRCYLAPRAPGSVCDAPSPNLPEAVRDRRPTEEETLPARANFGVVLTRATAIDWLSLASDGHQRARFTRDASGAWQGCWLEP